VSLVLMLPLVAAAHSVTGPTPPETSPAPAPAATSTRAADEEIIQDAMAPPSPALSGPRLEPPEPPRIWGIAFETRAATLTSWADTVGPKDVVEWRTWTVLDAGEKVTERLKWQLGVRFDLLARAQKGHGTFLVNEAYTFEARPWEAYVDFGLLDDLRIKIGNQIIAWGPLDLASASNMLGAYDWRQGPTVDPDALRIPTPSMVVSFYPAHTLAFDLGYTPFFTPDQFDLLGTNYALVGPNVPGAGSIALAQLRRQLTPATYAEFSDELARVTKPDARPDNGEVALRSTVHTRWLDLAASAGLLRAKLPAMIATPAFAQLLTGPPTAAALSAVNDSVQNGERLLDSRYDRYLQTALDSETAVGPLTLAAEGGYAPRRPIYLYDPNNPFPASAKSGLAQIGAKATYAGTLDSYVTAEVSLMVAADTPPTGTHYLGFAADNRVVVGLLAGRKVFGRHAFDAAVLGTSSGPSLILIGRYGYKVTGLFTVGVGGLTIAGPSAYDGSVGSIAKGLDQVFVFASYKP
jgi:hypothetical protein